MKSGNGNSEAAAMHIKSEAITISTVISRLTLTLTQALTTIKDGQQNI